MGWGRGLNASVACEAVGCLQKEDGLLLVDVAEGGKEGLTEGVGGDGAAGVGKDRPTYSEEEGRIARPEGRTEQVAEVLTLPHGDGGVRRPPRAPVGVDSRDPNRTSLL